MPDPLTPEQRHRCMSHIRGKDTKPELLVRKYLYAHGYRYRLHEKRLPGKPDIVLKRLHTVILVNGCFWHGHVLDDGTNCRYFVMPRSRTEFWQSKIARNRQRDKDVRRELTSLGWNVIQIWECQLRPSAKEATLQSLLLTLSQIELSILGCRRPKPYDYEEMMPQRMAADDSEIGYEVSESPEGLDQNTKISSK